VFADHFHINIFRFEITGLTEEHLRDALPLKLVDFVQWRVHWNGKAGWWKGKASCGACTGA
jgi:hypothetical protein